MAMAGGGSVFCGGVWGQIPAPAAQNSPLQMFFGDGGKQMAAGGGVYKKGDKIVS
ncbi:MAG: hypothetical protein Q8R08_00160 [bacterium]|nr:hypothetical protein [bacterium]